jgi:hypothetical protein
MTQDIHKNGLNEMEKDLLLNISDAQAQEIQEKKNDQNFQKNQKDGESLLLKYIHQVNTNSFENITRDFRGKKLENYLSTAGKLNSLQKQVLIGLLLGDGALQSNGGTNYFFKFDQKEANQQYVSLVYLIFQQFVGTHPKLRLKNGEPHSWWFRTYRLSFLKFYHDQFYALNAHGNSVRIIPKLLHRWITPISLAFWFMDDGSKVTSGYVLHTQCFLLSEIKILQKILGNKFGLEISIQSDTKEKTKKKYYMLYISAKSVQKFNDLVKSYIIPCMQYKLHNLDQYVGLDSRNEANCK